MRNKKTHENKVDEKDEDIFNEEIKLVLEKLKKY